VPLLDPGQQQIVNDLEPAPDSAATMRTLRLVKALQASDANGVTTPAGAASPERK